MPWQHRPHRARSGRRVLVDSKNCLGEATVDNGRVDVGQIQGPRERSSWRTLLPAFKATSASRAGRVTAACGVRPWVQPIVVLSTRLPQRAVEDSVQFVHGKAVMDWLASQPPRLNTHQLERLLGTTDAVAAVAARQTPIPATPRRDR